MIITPTQAMNAPVLNMDEKELWWIAAWCEQQCKQLGGDGMAMERYDKRLKEVMAELERRRTK